MLRPVYETEIFKIRNSNYSNLEEFYNFAKNEGFILYSGFYDNFYCEADGYLNQFHILPDLSVWKCNIDLEKQDAKIGIIDKKGSLIIDEQKLNKFYNKNPFFSN